MRVLRWAIALLLLAAVGFAVFLVFWAIPQAPTRVVDRTPALIAKGAYLAKAGDCVSCHTAEGGVPYAGGRALATPFGTIYASNITPDTEHGIGAYSPDDFYNALHYGAVDLFAPLYPAMPYTSFHEVTQPDTDALYAYFMSLEPVAEENKAPKMGFPYNIRPLMYGWNLMFAEREPFEPDTSRSEAWNRGAYLVVGLGHCGECHTPRGLMGQMKEDEKFAGSLLNGLEAPDIRAASLAERGWTQAQLVTYFQTGESPHGTAFGEMFLAVKNSLRKLTDSDLEAIALYLMDGAEAAKPAASAPTHKAEATRDGEELYAAYCAQCHGAEGRGMVNVFPPLVDNSTVAEKDGVNLIAVMANGIQPETSSTTLAYGPMPAFRDRMSAAEMAELANYVRATFARDASSLAELTKADAARVLKETAGAE